MAQILNTNNGMRNGKLGATVTVNRRGKTYERLAPTGYHSNTPQQKQQRNKFRVAVEAFSRLAPVFTIGFDRVSQPGCTGYNTGLGYNMNLALRQIDQTWQVDWDLVTASFGTLANIANPQLTLQPNQPPQLNWDPNTGTNAHPTDLLYLAIYNTRLRLNQWLIKGTSQRRDLNAPLPKSPLFLDPDSHLFLFTKRQSTNHVSPSIHIHLNQQTPNPSQPTNPTIQLNQLNQLNQ